MTLAKPSSLFALPSGRVGRHELNGYIQRRRQGSSRGRSENPYLRIVRIISAVFFLLGFLLLCASVSA